MTWKDKIREGSYTSPSGEKVYFKCKDVSRGNPKKTVVTDYVDTNISYVRDNGMGGKTYPMEIYFQGPDYDVEAAKFDDMLDEIGPGKLIHPFYKIKSKYVIPIGEYIRTDQLTSKGNQAVYTITFKETAKDEYPQVINATASDLGLSIESVLDSAVLDISLSDITAPGNKQVF